MSGVTTVTIKPAEAAALDTYMDEQNAATNYGTNAELWVGVVTPLAVTYKYTAWIKFDIAGNIPANANISAATLSLWVATDMSDESQTVYVSRCLRNVVEAQCTYNIYSTGNSWASGGGLGSGTDIEAATIGSCAFTSTESAGTQKQFTLTASKVQEWLTGALANYGMVVHQTTGTNAFWKLHSSSSATAGYYPQLVITYTTPSGVIWWG